MLKKITNMVFWLYIVMAIINAFNKNIEQALLWLILANQEIEKEMI